MAATPRLGWYGDDFTGATDTLAALAKAGQRALLFLDVPDIAQLGEAGQLDAVGIAGAARSMAPDAMRAELEPVGRFFAALGVAVMHYKCCSTFDSAAHVGSIGEAVRTLAPHFPNRFRPVVGGQPNIGRYCLFSTLFAAAGTGGMVHRIDRHPTMSVHPVTPMAEADLRRHLAAQGLWGMAALHFPEYGLDDDGLDDDGLDGRLERLLADGPAALLLDVSRAEDLAVVGRLIWQRAVSEPLLAVGPSSVAQALVAHWNAGSDASVTEETPLAAAETPVFLMAGSLSPVTRRQIEAAGSYTRIRADAAALCGDPGYAETLLGEVAASLAAGRHTLVWTAPAEAGTADTAQAGRVAAATAEFVAAVLRRVPVRRVGIAGGDTSSLAVRALGCWGLSYRCTLAPGVTVSHTHADDPSVDGLELMLKGGQMGGEDLFERLLG